MLVYGDRSRAGVPSELVADIVAFLDRARSLCGESRHDLLTNALILAGQLAQGVADRELGGFARDEVTPDQEATMVFAVAIARMLRDEAAVAPPAPILSSDAGITLKAPEGYDFYAVHPDHYAAAALSAEWSQPPLVIGLRSIGTSLAAMVAAVTGGDAISMRPLGHPFARTLRPSDRLRARIASHRGLFVIVDEGPGLSGSSFGAAGDLLEAIGIGLDRMVFMPSHDGGPGSRSSPRHRSRWERCRKLVARYDEDTGRRLAGGAIDDLSGGRWRIERPAPLPPFYPMLERRKYRWKADDGRRVARFTGLGLAGEAKWIRAQVLHEEGFIEEPLALTRGFLIQRWAEARPFDPAGPDRGRFLAHLARYIGFRALRFPAAPQDGAGSEELYRMATLNAAALCGPEVAARVGERLKGLGAVRERCTPVHVDGRLHPWEWLRYPDGRFFKADALDHSCDHGLIGCQDAAWDVAGAVVEFQLSKVEAETLRSAVEAVGGRSVTGESVAMFVLCYAAFQGGAWHMAHEIAEAVERPRIACLMKTYKSVLAAADSQR